MNSQKSFPVGLRKSIVYFLFIWLAFGFSHGGSFRGFTEDSVCIDITDFSIVLCELVPGTEVASRSPFTIPFIKSEPWPTSVSPEGCRYKFESADKSESASIAIGVTDFANSKEALASHQNRDQMVRDNWNTEPEKVDSLGDTASGFGEDEVGLQVVTGRRILDVNLRGQFPDVTKAQKKEAARALARLVLSRLK